MNNKIIMISSAILFGLIYFILPDFLFIIPKLILIISLFVILSVFLLLILKLKDVKDRDAISLTNLNKKSKELAREKKRLKLTIENIQEGIIITDKNGFILDVNKKTLQILNTVSSKVINTKIQDIIHLKDGNSLLNFSNTFRLAVEDGKSFSLTDLILQIPNSSETKNIDDSLSPIINENNEVIGTVMVFRDVTKKLRLEEEKLGLEQKIDQLERIDVMGDFLSGIAHNFGNIVGNINGQIEMIKIGMVDKDKFKKRFDKIDNKIDESKQLIKKLSLFNTSAEFEKTPVNINELIESNKTSLLKIIPTNTNIKVYLESEKTVKIDLIDFDRLFLTILSYLKKNIEPDSYIDIHTYDGNEGVVLKFVTSHMEKEINYYMFNISEILKRNNAELITVTEEKETNIKILFKI